MAIRRAVTHWWPAGPGWLWWKAQLFQESRLDPAARSPVGAAGLAQFMPGTWNDMAPALGYAGLPPTAAGPAIETGAYYMAKLQSAWKSERPQLERHRLAQASYNAGTGHVVAAQRLCGDARLWDDITPCLPQVTGRHAAETIGYVRSIAAWKKKMEVTP